MEPEEFGTYMNSLSERFDRLCQERHIEGQEEYGKLSFLGNDVVRMMIEELADTANYCRYQAIKLFILQELLEKDPRLQEGIFEKDDENITMGFQAFKGTKDVGWGSS